MSQSSLNAVFVAHYSRLVTWCRARIGRQADPEDIVHNAYLRCQDTWDVARESTRNPTAYLYQSIRWEIADRSRSDRRRRGRETAVGLRQNAWQTSVSLTRAAAQEALSSLRGRPRDICRAVLNGKSSAEIQRDFGLSPGAFYVHLCRARALICAALDVPRRDRASPT